MGIGLADQAATIYASEMAPPHVRTRLDSPLLGMEPCSRAGPHVQCYSAPDRPSVALQLRGTLTFLFQLCVVTGILVAQAVNIGTHYIPFGWRISLGLAAIPGVVLLIGGLSLPETPNSLIERGYLQKVRLLADALRPPPPALQTWQT